jgi:hypothetical protein
MIPVILLRVERTLNAQTESALAFPNIVEILMLNVDLSAFSMMTVLAIELASETNA